MRVGVLVFLVLLAFRVQGKPMVEVPDSETFAAQSKSVGIQTLRTLQPIKVSAKIFPDWLLDELSKEKLGQIIEVDFMDGKVMGFGSRWPGAYERDFCTLLAVLKYTPGAESMNLEFSHLKLFEVYGYSRGNHHYRLANHKTNRTDPHHYKSNGAYAVSCTLNNRSIDDMTVGFLKLSLGRENIIVER